MSTVTIKGVELIRSGTWKDSKGRTVNISPDKIKNMFSNSQTLGFRPPIKLGHASQEDFRKSLKESMGLEFPADGLPAVGFSVPTHMKKSDNSQISLMGNLERVPKKAESLVKNYFRNRSAEILTIQDGKGGKIRDVFGGLALLGMTRPAIKQLAYSYSEPEFSEMKFDEGEPEVDEILLSDPEPEQESTSLSESVKSVAKALGIPESEIYELAASRGPENQISEDDMEGITVIQNGKQVVLKTPEDVAAFSEGVKTAALAGYVPKSQFEELQAKEQKRAKQAHQTKVKAAFSELRKPNEKGLALPPAVVDMFENVALAAPFDGDEIIEIQFSENGKEENLDLTAALSKGLEMLRGCGGLVAFREESPVSNTQQSGRERELRQEYKGLKQTGVFSEEDGSSEDEYVKMNLN